MNARILLKLLIAFVMLASLMAQTPLMAQTNEKKLDAVKEFKTYLQKYQDAPRIIEAVHTLKTNECPEAAAELVKLFDHKISDVRMAAVAVLGLFHDDETFKPYLDQLASLKTFPGRAQIIEAIGKAKIKAALPVFKEVLTRDKKLDVPARYGIARALMDIGKPAIKDEITLLLQDPDPVVRMAAADTVAKLGIRGTGKELVPLISDPAWQVQTAAIAAVAKIRAEEAIDPLIELMRKVGRFKEETADALFRITKLDFGAEPDEWAKQIKKLREIPGWRIPTDQEVAKAEESRQKNDAFYGRKKEDKLKFGGITTTSTNVLFIIDISGSMEELVIEHEKFTNGYEDWKKFTIVRTELTNTITSLKDNTNFNIIAFATDLHPWKNFLVPANGVNKDAALSWVKRLKPLGGVEAQEAAQAGLTGTGNVGAGKTNTYKSLMAMFGYDPDKQPLQPAGPLTGGAVKLNKESKLDTVFFLSDGRPSTGKFVDMNEILREVKERNQIYKIVLHTIAIGEFQKDFMKRLAQDNGGVFVDLGK